ncbi:hypothetical protein Emed_002562 [Eimeria media]
MEDDEVDDDETEDGNPPKDQGPGAAPQLPSDQAPGSPGSAGGGDNVAEEKTASALVCLTSPDALENNPLFTEQQWDKITKALSNSASVAVPSVLASAAVVSSVLLL